MARRSSLDDDKLCSAMAHARKVLEQYRTRRRLRVELYAGGDYSDEASAVPRPVNLIALYVNVFGKSLVAKSPRVMLSTRRRRHAPAVRAMQDWANRQVVKMDLAGTLQRAVIDALFQVGVVKVALATPADAAASAWGLRAGDPYAACVSLDDLVCDVMARDRAQMSYVGERMRLPLDAARAFFGRKGRDLEPTPKREHNEEGDDAADTLSGWATVGTKEEAYDAAEVYCVYLPREKRVRYYRTDGGLPYGPAVLDAEWVGPAAGPYHWLGFGWVPDSFMPKGTVGDLVDLDLDANASWRKLSREAERLKVVGLVESQHAEDGKAIQQASDGDIITVTTARAFVEARSGGPVAELMAFFSTVRDLFNFFGSNLAAVGGLAPQAKTATQEKLLAESANATVAAMQGDAVGLATSVMTSLSWYWWNSPFKVMETEYDRPGLPRPIPRRLYPAGAVGPATGRPRDLRRDLPFDELDLRVDPYSVQQSTPQAKSNALKAIVTQLVAPMLGLLQQQGVTLDMPKLMHKIGEYDDLPDLAEILNLVDPPVDPQAARGGAGQDGAGMPTQTERTYTRQSVPQDTEATREQEAVEMMAAAKAERNGKSGGY